MSQIGRTKEERYLLALNEISKGVNACDRYQVGNSIGLHPKGVDVICRDLLQCNFIKKAGDIDVIMTQHGKDLAAKLLEM